MAGGSARIKRQHAGVSRRDPLLRRRQAGDLGDQDAPVRLVRPLQAEILAPVQQQIGSRIAPEQVAQPAKLGGMLFIKEDRLQVQPVEQHQAAQTVGPLDRLGISPEPLGHAGDQAAILRRGRLVLRQQLGLRIRLGIGRVGWRRDSGRGCRRPGRGTARAARFERQLDQHHEGGQQRGYGKGSLHRWACPE